jgi:hypothetical protein
MNWTRYKLLIISGGITLVLSGILVFWIISTGNTNTEIDREIETLKQSQDRLVDSRPYPSERNLAELISENEKVRERRDQIKEVIRNRQFTVPNINRSRFGDYVRGQWVPELQELARQSVKGGENGVILAEPSFGLQQYLDGVLPEPRRLPSLLLEMEAKAHLSRLLFETGISELLLVQPIMERPDRPAAPQPSFPGSGAQSGQAPVESAETRTSIEAEVERLFEWVPFRLEFRIYEDFFWETLNHLLADPNQIVLTRLALTNSNQLLWPDYLQPRVTGGARSRTRRETARPPDQNSEMMALLEMETGATPAAESPERSMMLPGLSERRQYSVGGDLLNVVMEVKIYRLKPATPESNQGS